MRLVENFVFVVFVMVVGNDEIKYNKHVIVMFHVIYIYVLCAYIYVKLDCTLNSGICSIINVNVCMH